MPSPADSPPAAPSALELGRQLQSRFGEAVSGPVEFRGEATVRVADPGRIPEICAFARRELGFDFLVDITSVDQGETAPRFTIVYELYGFTHRQHLRLTADLPEENAEAPTVTPVWRGADWLEREVYDMMGIRFAGHPDPRRILMWEGYPHHPLRKDFPLEGRPTDLPEVAFTLPAPLEGGPFVAATGSPHATDREPRARRPLRADPGSPNPAAAAARSLAFPDAAARARGPLPGSRPGGPEPAGDTLVLNMGPSHPATHGVLRILLELDGEIVRKATPDIGYLHRGDEKIAEHMTYAQFIPYTDRLDYLAPLANNVAYVLAVEKLLGIDDRLTPRCQYIRVICCELARISAHLLGLGCFAMDLGAMTVFLYAFTEREKVYNLVEALSGARFTASYTRIGGLARDLPPDWTRQLRQFLHEVVVTIDDIDRLLTRNRIFVDRTRGVGAIPRDMAIDFGLTGPNLRASGVDHDLRRDHPYLAYRDLAFEVPTGTAGDCYDRYLVRMEEMRQSVRLLHQCLDHLPDGPIDIPDGKVVLPPKRQVLTRMEELIHQFMLVTQGVNAPPGQVYFAAENPKGELGFYISSRGGGVPHRLKIRSPSFVSISLLPHLLPGLMISDIMAVLGSLDFVMGECDR